jgi:hypothetical protein
VEPELFLRVDVMLPREETTMRWKISPYFHFRLGPGSRDGSRGHDPRTLDMIAIIALLALVVGSGWYLATSIATPASTTAFIVPSQSVHW